MKPTNKSNKELSLTEEDLEFILKTLQTSTIRLTELEQAVTTVSKLQELYRLLNEKTS